jgi:parallel beta-helix repeat protein
MNLYRRCKLPVVLTISLLLMSSLRVLASPQNKPLQSNSTGPKESQTLAVDPVDRHVGPGQQYSTIQAAVNAASDGDRIIVHPGIYVESVLILNKTLTLMAYNYSDMPVIIGSPCFNVTSLKYNDISISGFVMENCNYGVWIAGVADADISNNTISTFYAEAILMSYTVYGDAKVDYNTITSAQNGVEGIDVNQARGKFEANGNSIEFTGTMCYGIDVAEAWGEVQCNGNTVSTMGDYGYGIFFGWNMYSGLQINDNNVRSYYDAIDTASVYGRLDISRNTLYSVEGDDIYIGVVYGEANITNNVVTNPAGTGIYITYTYGNCDIMGNTINATLGIYSYGMYIDTVYGSATILRNAISFGFAGIYIATYLGPHSLIAHNTIYNETDYGIYLEASVPGTVAVKNNIIVGANWTAPYTTTGVYGGVSGNCPIGVGYNDLYMCNLTGSTYSPAYGDISLEPQFINADAGDYRLSATSPCIDTGIYIGLPYNGAAPDMGAFEAASTFLVVRGYDNRIYYRIYDSNSATWGSWNILPGATCDSPAAATVGNNLHIVVRGMDGYTLWYGYVNLTDSTFHGWTVIDGSTPSAPTLTSNGTVLYLVVRGWDNAIYYRYNVGGSWGSWNVVPSGLTVDSPAVAMLGNNLHIVVRGMDGSSLYHSSVDLSTGVFSGWELMNGPVQSKPTLAACESRGEVCLVVRGMDNVVYYNTWNGMGWVGWVGLPGGSTPDGPAATVVDGNLQVVVKGIDGNIWSGTLDLTTETYSDWTWLNGATPSAPTLTH